LSHTKPCVPAVVHPDEAEHVRREAVVGVEAAALLDRVDALQAEPFDGLGLVRRHLPPEPHEALRAGRPAAHGLERKVEGRGERGEARVLPAELARPHVDRRDIEREGERLAVAVDDRAAMRRELDPRPVLQRGQPRQVGSAEHGQVDGAEHDQREQTGEHTRHREHARLRRPGRGHRRITTCPLPGSCIPSRRRARSPRRPGSRSVASSTSSSRCSCSRRSCMSRAAESW